jgi:hypothetical protein
VESQDSSDQESEEENHVDELPAKVEQPVKEMHRKLTVDSLVDQQ